MIRSRKFLRLAACLLAALLPFSLAAKPGLSATGVDGVEVTIDEPADRIVSLAPHLSELLFDAGAGDALVGAVAYSDYPPAAREVPRVGDAFRVDLERIVALEPDLVLAWESGNPADAVSRLRELGVPVLVTETRELADIPRLVGVLGRLAGTGATAGRAMERFRRRIDSLREQYAESETVRVFFQATARPLYTVGGRHVITEVIELCGGRNVFDSLGDLAPTVGEEAVMAADPRVIVAGSQPGEPKPLERWRRWPAMRAVSSGHLYRMDGDLIHRATTRIAKGAEQLCRILDEARGESAGR